MVKKEVSTMVTIEPYQWRFPIRPGQSLLEASLAAGIRIPHSCRNGTCRACLCKKTDGIIRYRIEWPGLSAEEKADSWILPCIAEAHSDITVFVPAALSVTTQDDVPS